MRKRMLFLALCLVLFVAGLSVSSTYAQAGLPVREPITVNTSDFKSAKDELDKLKKKLGRHEAALNKCSESYEEVEKIVDSRIRNHPMLTSHSIDVTKHCVTFDSTDLDDIKTLVMELGKFKLRDWESATAVGWTKEQFEDFSKQFSKQWDRFKRVLGKWPSGEDTDRLLRKAQNLQ